MKNKFSAELVLWEVIVPLFLYYFLHLFILLLARDYIGGGTSNYMLCQIIADVITIPVMYFLIYRKNRNVIRVYNPTIKERALDIVLEIIAFVFISWGLNNLIVMSPLVSISEGFSEANASFYGSTLVIELIGAGILAPLLEELVFRGIVYGALRKIMGMWPAVIISAVLFALVHFNVVQFIYALAMGIVLALCMEYVGNLYGAIIGHIVANSFAVLRTENNWFSSLVDKDISSWISASFFLGIGLALFYLFYKKMEKTSS